MIRSTLKLNPIPGAQGWRCRKCNDSVNTMTRTCRGCGLVVARAISNDHYEAESTGPAYQPPSHAFPDDDTPLGALRPHAALQAKPVGGRMRRRKHSSANAER